MQHFHEITFRKITIKRRRREEEEEESMKSKLRWTRRHKVNTNGYNWPSWETKHTTHSSKPHTHAFTSYKINSSMQHIAEWWANIYIYNRQHSNIYLIVRGGDFHPLVLLTPLPSMSRHSTTGWSVPQGSTAKERACSHPSTEPSEGAVSPPCLCAPNTVYSHWSVYCCTRSHWLWLPPHM